MREEPIPRRIEGPLLRPLPVGLLVEMVWVLREATRRIGGLHLLPHPVPLLEPKPVGLLVEMEWVLREEQNASRRIGGLHLLPLLMSLLVLRPARHRHGMFPVSPKTPMIPTDPRGTLSPPPVLINTLLV